MTTEVYHLKSTKQNCPIVIIVIYNTVIKINDTRVFGCCRVLQRREYAHIIIYWDFTSNFRLIKNTLNAFIIVITALFNVLYIHYTVYGVSLHTIVWLGYMVVYTGFYQFTEIILAKMDE